MKLSTKPNFKKRKRPIFRGRGRTCQPNQWRR